VRGGVPRPTVLRVPALTSHPPTSPDGKDPAVLQQQGRLNGYQAATRPTLARWLKLFADHVWRPDLTAVTAESNEFQRRRGAIRALLTTAAELGLAPLARKVGPGPPPPKESVETYAHV